MRKDRWWFRLYRGLGFIVGHTKLAKGAHSQLLGYEYDWNLQLAKLIGKPFETRDEGGLLGAHKKLAHCSGTIELHFNSLNCIANGTETLYATPQSKELAELVQSLMVHVLGLKNRGIKRIQPLERGHKNLIVSTKPSILIEPCFGDNTIDAQVMKDKLNEFALAMHSLTY